MDENLFQKQKPKRATRPPAGDRETVDMFTGEPFGAPPTPRKLSKGGRTLLEVIIARERVKVTGLASSMEGDISAGQVAGLVQELRRAGFIVDQLPHPGAARADLETVPTEEGRDWLRRRRIEEGGKEPPKPKETPDPQQADVLDAEEGQRRADEGMRQAFDHQTDEWKAWALNRVRYVLRVNERITVDDVWDEIGRQPYTHSEGSAMGAVMRKAASRGWCRKTGDSQRSERAANHGAIRPVWLSLIYEPRDRR